MTYPPKILGQVTSCGKCPNYTYYSGGMHHCGLVDELVRDKSIVAPFCPLPDYPSRTIAEMQSTILGLREPLKSGFGTVLMTHVATKLKLDLRTNGTVLAIPFKDGKKDREVYLETICIREITMRPFEITFMSSGCIFKLCPDTNPPVLREAADNDGLWSKHALAV